MPQEIDLTHVKEEISEETEKHIEEIKHNLESTLEEQGAEQVKKKVEMADAFDILDEQFFNSIIQMSPTTLVEEYIKSTRQAIQDEVPLANREGFNLDKYRDLNKSNLAKQMAHYCVQRKEILPVDIGDGKNKTTEFFSYNYNEKRYVQISSRDVKRKCQELAEDESTLHLKREFVNSIVDGSEVINMDEMGLDAYHVLMDNGKILKIHNPRNPEVREASPSDYALYKINTTYNPDADCPQFKDFVSQLLNEDKEQIMTLQEFMGWCLKYPDNEFDRALMILGATNTGKSQLTKIIQLMFSQDSYTNLPFTMIGMERTFHVGRLKNSVLNIDRDLASQTIESPHIIKQVISQERVDVEEKGEGSYSCVPTAKHVIASNVSPSIDNADDDGFYSRFVTLTAPNTVDPEERVNNLAEKIFEEEAQGILNWMLEGLYRLQKVGQFTLTQSAYENKQLWNRYGDSVQKFIWDCIEPADDGDGEFISTHVLYDYYVAWCSDKIHEVKSKRNFSQVLDDQSFMIKTQGSGMDGSIKRGFKGFNLDIPEKKLDE